MVCVASSTPGRVRAGVLIRDCMVVVSKRVGFPPRHAVG
jgi:hypothetical protein